MKARVSFLLDTHMLDAELSVEEVREFVMNKLVRPARVVAKHAIKEVRTDSGISQQDKTAVLSGHLRSMAMTLMVEANLDVKEVDPQTPVSDRLPFEKDSRHD